MNHQFTNHFTVNEARNLLPQVRTWFSEIDALTDRLRETNDQLTTRLQTGADLGGPLVEGPFRDMGRVQQLLHEFTSRQIQVKDLQRGLIDFPAFLDDREVFLCWERTEDELTHWHDLESGYSGRQSLWEY